MKKIYLIRHCAPDFPGGQKKCISSTDLPLSQAGLAQAAALWKPEVTALFSSPLTRCVQTARAFGKSVTLLEGLREMGVGEWEDLTFAQIRERYPAQYAARGLDPALPPPGGEARAAALCRFRAALEAAAAQAPGDLAVITHGGILEVFWESLTGVRRKPSYGEMWEVCWEEGEFFPVQDRNSVLF